MGENNFLPFSADVESGVEFRVVDFKEATASGTADATGKITATFDQVAPDYWWEIERMSVQSDSAAASQAIIYAGDPNFRTNVRDSTLSGNLAVSDNASPIRLSASQQLTVVWTGATPNTSHGWAWCQYKLLKRVNVRKG